VTATVEEAAMVAAEEMDDGQGSNAVQFILF
jgi:hypothetical protein